MQMPDSVFKKMNVIMIFLIVCNDVFSNVFASTVCESHAEVTHTLIMCRMSLMLLFEFNKMSFTNNKHYLNGECYIFLQTAE